MSSAEFYLFLPQMRMSMESVVGRARAAEAAGFVGMAGMDHLAPPYADHAPMYEAMVTNTWVASRTDRLRVSSLVLCDSFRHPAVLARQAVSLDHASEGRFDLGIGWGSVPAEFTTFGVGTTEPSQRVARLKETLEIVKALWSGETIDYVGRFFTVKGAMQAPTPRAHIPIIIGGLGQKTMELVSAHADWWNLHRGALHRLEDKRAQAGPAKISLQIQVGLAAAESDRRNVSELARRRFGDRPVIGTAPELVEQFAALVSQDIRRFYVWFTDFAPPETLARFGEEVIRKL